MCSIAGGVSFVSPHGPHTHLQVENMDADAGTATYAASMRENLKFFEDKLPEYWEGMKVNNPMEEYAKLENEWMVQQGMMKEVSDAHFWSSGVSFRSKHL